MSIVPILDGVNDTTLYLVVFLNYVCCGVYWCLKMNARVYLMSLIFLLPQRSLVFWLCLVLYKHCSHLKKMQFIMLIYWFCLINKPRRMKQIGMLHAWGRMEYMYKLFVDIGMGVYLSCFYFIWCWSFMNMVMYLWVHITIEKLEYRCFFNVTLHGLVGRC